MEKPSSNINENTLWVKISKFAKKAGTKVIYSVLLLWYAYQRKETPSWAKRIILGTIAYFLAPIDAIPDLTPLFGFTDDLGVLGIGLVAIAAYINDEVRSKAREKLSKWFDTYNEADLEAVDKQL